jgi:UDP-N-acetylglucosamine pyrophosphorylase
MGLESAKSLLPVKNGDTFLDFIARQILQLRATTASLEPGFYLMNSFSTQNETLSYLRKYTSLTAGEAIDFLQNMAPKIDAKTFEPVTWSAQPTSSGALPDMATSFRLSSVPDCSTAFLPAGSSSCLFRTPTIWCDRRCKAPAILRKPGSSFLMEVAERTGADRKGGHLAQRKSTGRLLLRELAQCPEEDESHFQNIERHRFFNTNNLWVRLDRIKEELERNGGALPLPLITNSKTVDPRDPSSTKVLQLESAMGAAIECFDRSGAVVVPRTRFAPVKTTSDLLVLRSDACRVTEDHRLILVEERVGSPPLVDLDAKHYKLLQDFERYFPDGPPSLVRCESLKIRGPVAFAKGVVCEGKVEFINPSAETRIVPAGHYRNQSVHL